MLEIRAVKFEPWKNVKYIKIGCQSNLSDPGDAFTKYFFVFLGYTGWLLCYGHPMTSLSIKQLFLNFSAVLWEKIKQTIYGNLPTPHIQVTLYTHTYFCSKMAIIVTITKSVSKPKNSAKNGCFTSNFTSIYKDFDGKYHLTTQRVQIWT